MGNAHSETNTAVESRQDLNESADTGVKVPGLAVSMNESEGGSLVGDNKSGQGTTTSGGSYSYMFTTRTLSGAAGGLGVCGSISDTFTGDDVLVVKSDRRESEKKRGMLNSSSMLARAAAGTLCASEEVPTEPATTNKFGPDVDSDDEFERAAVPGGAGAGKVHPMSALFARALVSEVTDNPRTMPPAAMAQREKRLLRAQERARKARTDGVRAVGTPGGVVDPEAGVLEMVKNLSLGGTAEERHSSNVSSMFFSETPAAPRAAHEDIRPVSKHSVTIALCLSRNSPMGHPDTVTRQTAFDFNELQDRQYRFLSSTDSSGWLAGGGESGGPPPAPDGVDPVASLDDVDEAGPAPLNNGFPSAATTDVDEGWLGSPSGDGNSGQKVAAPDMVHIPIIQIDADSKATVDSVISAIARGEVFIPHMAITPEMLAVDGISPPDLTVRFGCERNEALFPDEWQNWCLEFMHNQLYEYFAPMGARWMRRPFQITLARKVRWKTVKHMKKYLARCERVINSWREQGPKYLDPQLSYVTGGTTPEEVVRPHGIYLLRNGRPTNYFAPNFHPPYTTKMTRSLLMNVLGKSWDDARHEWTSEPVPRIVTPTILMTTLCGCTDPANQGGFVALEATSGDTTRHHVVGDARSVSERSDKGVARSFTSSPTGTDPLSLERDLQVAAATTHSFVSIDAATAAKQKDELVGAPAAASSEAMDRELPDDDDDKPKVAVPTVEEPPRVEEPLTTSAPAPTAVEGEIGGGFGLGAAASPFIPVFEPFTNDERGAEDASNLNDVDNTPPWKIREGLFRKTAEPEMDGAVGEPEADKKAGSLATVPEDSIHKERASHMKRTRQLSSKGRAASEDSVSPQEAQGEEDDFGKKTTVGVRDVAPHSNTNSGKRTSPTKRIRGKWSDLSQTDGSIDEDMALSAAPSEGANSMGISVGESHTTVPTMNSSPAKFIERERERRRERERQREKERKRMEVLEKAIRDQMLKGKERQEEEAAELEKENATREAKAKKENEVKKEKKKEKKRKEKEKDSGIALVTLNPPPTENVDNDPLSLFPKSMIPGELPENAAPNPKSKPSPDAARLMAGGGSQVYSMPSAKGTTTSMSTTTTQQQQQQQQHSTTTTTTAEGVERTNSQVSLEYSMDSSVVGGDGPFATDETVATGGTGNTAAQSLLSYVTRNSDATTTTSSTEGKQQQQQQQQRLQVIGPVVKKRPPEDFETTPQSSSSSESVVPSDEELFAVGWAKALDPSSGSYYYFTLDRSTIVWDNPLARDASTTSTRRR